MRSCSGRGDAPQGYLLRCVGIASYEKIVGKPCVGADAHIRPSLPPSKHSVLTPPSQREARGVPRLRARGDGFPRARCALGMTGFFDSLSTKKNRHRAVLFLGYLVQAAA